MAMLRQPEPEKAYPSGEQVAKDSAGEKVAGNPVLDALQTLGMYAVSLREKGNPAAAEAFKGFLDAIMGGGGAVGAKPPAEGPGGPPPGAPGPAEPAGAEEPGDMPEGEEMPPDEEMPGPGMKKGKMRGMRPPTMAPKGFRKEATVL